MVFYTFIQEISLIFNHRVILIIFFSLSNIPITKTNYKQQIDFLIFIKLLSDANCKVTYLIIDVCDSVYLNFILLLHLKQQKNHYYILINDFVSLPCERVNIKGESKTYIERIWLESIQAELTVGNFLDALSRHLSFIHILF